MGGPKSNTHAAAAYYHGLGYRPVPIPAKEKGARILNWPKYKFDEATAAYDFPDESNIGIIMGGGLACVDIDHQIGLDLAEGILPATDCVIGRPGRPGCHWFYRVEGELKTKKFAVKIREGQGEKTMNLIDFLAGRGSQVVVGPSIHPTGDLYDCLEGEPATVDANALFEAVKDLFAKTKAVLVANGVEIVENTKPVTQLASKVTGAPLRACPAGEAPGTVFNCEHPGPLLIRHGWTLVSRDEIEKWRRPGKAEGTSATLTNHCGVWQFYNFSSNVNLPQAENLSPHALLAHLEHGGDFKAAAKALRGLGFGDNAGGDLSGLLGNTGLAACHPVMPDEEPEVNDPALEAIAFPTECLEPPGFLGDLIRHNLETAIHKQPLLALAGALAALSTLTNRVMCDLLLPTYTNLYIIGLAPSGAGKEHGRRVNKDLFQLAGLGGKLGEGIGSAQGVMAALGQNQSLLLQLDEMADMFTTLGQAKGSSAYLQQVAPLLKTLKTSAGSIWKSPVLRSAENCHTVIAPHLVVYGTSVAAALYESLTVKQLSDGLVSRFIIVDAGRVRVTPRTDGCPTKIPNRLVALAMAWAKLDTSHSSSDRALRPCHYKMKKSPKAVARLIEYQAAINTQQINDERGGNIDRAALWSRVVENVSSFALLRACSRATFKQVQTAKLTVVELEDVNWAILVVDALTKHTISMATKHVGLSVWEGKLKRALAKLGSTRHLVRNWRTKCGHFEKGEFDIAIRELQEAGRIEGCDEPTKGRPKVWVWRSGN